MKNQLKYFLSGIVIIMLSTPLAKLSIEVFYVNENLTIEFIPMLEGFIHSYMLVGILIFGIGIINLFKKDAYK